MFRKIRIEKDREGRPVQIGVVVNPDDETIPKILELLAHKGEIFLWQVKKLYGSEAGATESRLFVAKRGSGIVSTAMLAEYSGIAILGHVFTAPEERRKGISSILLKLLLDDFKKRRGRIITLYTDYGGHSYRYYQKHGLIGLEETGIMYFPETAPEIRKKIYSPVEAAIRSARWEDYPVITDMALDAGEFPIKVFATEAVGRPYFESHFLYLAQNREKDPRNCRIKVLARSSNDFPVGLACTMPDKTRPEGTYCLDCFVYPGYEDYLEELMASVALPSPVVAYAESDNVLKKGALEKLGFRIEGELPEPIFYRRKSYTVEMYRR